MKFVDMEIKFSKIGPNNLARHHHGNIYVPVIVITFAEPARQKRVPLSTLITDKSAVKNVLAGGSFYSILLDDNYMIYDSEGHLWGSVSSTHYGRCINITDDRLYLLKGRTMTTVSNKAEIVCTHRLSDKELSDLKRPFAFVS